MTAEGTTPTRQTTGPGIAGKRSVFAPEYRSITLSTLTLLALAAFDGMSVTAALPEIGGDLGVRLLPWVLTAFMLTSTVAMLAAGTIIDALGVTRTYRFTLVIFFFSSALCTVAPNLDLLIVARVIQGVGGGLVMATTISIVGLSFPAELRARAYAANSTVWGVMALIGPALAALMVSVGSWRWIFAVNLPLVAFAAAVGWSRLPGADSSSERLRFDLRGLLLVAAFATTTLLGLSELRSSSVLAAAGAIALLALYWVHSGLAANPILARRYFAEAPFGLLNAIPLTFFAGSLAIDAFVPLYVRGGLGKSNTTSAFAVAFLALGWTSGSQIVSRLLDRIANTTAMVSGFAITIPAIATGALLYTSHTPVGLVFAISYLQGLGIGAVTNATLSLLQRTADTSEMGRASAAHQFLRNLGGTLGTAVAGGVLFLVVERRVGGIGLVKDLLAGHDAAIALPARTAIAAGFRAAAVVALVFTLIGFAFALQTRRFLSGQTSSVPADVGLISAAQATRVPAHPSPPEKVERVEPDRSKDPASGWSNPGK
jgi:MFS family permease